MDDCSVPCSSTVCVLLDASQDVLYSFMVCTCVPLRRTDTEAGIAVHPKVTETKPIFSNPSKVITLDCDEGCTHEVRREASQSRSLQ